MPDFAKQDSDIAATWGKLRGEFALNTGSGQAFRHPSQNVHSPTVKSSVGRE